MVNTKLVSMIGSKPLTDRCLQFVVSSCLSHTIESRRPCLAHIIPILKSAIATQSVALMPPTSCCYRPHLFLDVQWSLGVRNSLRGSYCGSLNAQRVSWHPDMETQSFAVNKQIHHLATLGRQLSEWAINFYIIVRTEDRIFTVNTLSFENIFNVVIYFD